MSRRGEGLGPGLVATRALVMQGLLAFRLITLPKNGVSNGQDTGMVSYSRFAK